MIQSAEVSEINISGEFTSSQGVGRERGDTFIVGDTLTFTVSMTDDNELQNNDDMQVRLTLSNSKVLNLTRPGDADDTATGADKIFTASYVIEDGDEDVTELTVNGYAVQNIVDISGNPATNTKSLDAIDITFGGKVSDGVSPLTPTLQRRNSWVRWPTRIPTDAARASSCSRVRAWAPLW